MADSLKRECGERTPVFAIKPDGTHMQEKEKRGTWLKTRLRATRH